MIPFCIVKCNSKLSRSLLLVGSFPRPPSSPLGWAAAPWEGPSVPHGSAQVKGGAEAVADPAPSEQLNLKAHVLSRGRDMQGVSARKGATDPGLEPMGVLLVASPGRKD